MTGLAKKVADGIDAINAATGSAVRWLTLFTVLVCLTVALLRYLFSIGFVWMQELYVWSHALVFMLAAASTYLADGHVRVDVISGRLSPRKRAVIECVGIVLLLFPWLAVLGYVVVPYVQRSWRLLEASQQYGGMPGLFLLKSALIVFVVLLFLQGVSVLLRNLLFLAGRADRPAPSRQDVPEVEATPKV